MSRRLRKQAVVKIKGDADLVEEIIRLLEPRTEGSVSSIMPCDYGGDYHAFVTVFRVVKE